MCLIIRYQNDNYFVPTRHLRLALKRYQQFYKKMNGTIHHIEINVSDLEKSTGFWKWLLTEKFSYTILQNWDNGISFKFEETYLVFVQTDKEYLDSSFHRKNVGINHLAFHCGSREFVDLLTKELRERNINILYVDRHPFAGGNNNYAVFFECPDKIKIEVVANETRKNLTINNDENSRSK